MADTTQTEYPAWIQLWVRILVFAILCIVFYAVGSYLLNAPEPSDAQITCMRAMRPLLGFAQATEYCATVR